MVFCSRADDDPTLNTGLVICDCQGIRASIAKKNLYFCDFSGGGEGGGPHILILTWFTTASRVTQITTPTTFYTRGGVVSWVGVRACL